MLKIIIITVRLIILPKKNIIYKWIIIIRILIFISVILIFYFPIGLNIYNIFFFFFFDGLNIPLLILRFWIFRLILMSRFKLVIIKDKSFFFILNLLILNVILFICFVLENLVFFYLIFEFSLIPTIIIIMVWGNQPERLQARFYFMIYTVSASLPLLIGIFLINKINFRVHIVIINWNLPMKIRLNIIWWIIIIIAFLIKIPLFLFHLWLPKAHVEAPVAGSIILAAVLLKLGRYGIIRVITIFFENRIKLIRFIRRLAIIGACITRAICLRQSDLKSIIAYSSVGHIGLVIIGIYSYTSWGWYGALGIIIAHGVCSSAIFSIANIVYEYIGRRRIILIKGLIIVFPYITIWWFLLIVGNMRGPPTFNLFSEILILVSILNSSIIFSGLFILLRFLVGGFSLVLYVSRQHGKVSVFMNPIIYRRSLNFNILFFHVTPIYFLLFYPYGFYFSWV